MEGEDNSADFHFDLETARELLPWLKKKLQEMDELGNEGRSALESYDIEHAEALTIKIQEIMEEIHDAGIIFRDSSTLLFDFPAIINNMPAYLCWSIEEEGLEYWHYVDEGFAGRKRITGQENILSSL